MKIFHHNDNDGLCAAAIIKNECENVYDRMTNDDFFEYSHSGKIDTPEFNENENVYIVDLALDDVIFNNVIKPAVLAGAKVIHIDHHATTLDYYDKLKNIDDVEILKKVCIFHKIGLSGALLTWVFCCMNVDEKQHPMDVNFDFADKYTHVAFYPETPKMREYAIPDVIRLINDRDVWNNELKDSKMFSLGFGLVTDKHPSDTVWQKLIYYGSLHGPYEYVSSGYIIDRYITLMNENYMKSSFESEICGHKVLCLNGYGNSDVFGNKFDEYPMVCLFNYDGSLGKWRYSFYSSEKVDGSVNVGELAKSLGGGGHKNAAGCVLSENIFDKNK